MMNAAKMLGKSYLSMEDRGQYLIDHYLYANNGYLLIENNGSFLNLHDHPCEFDC